MMDAESFVEQDELADEPPRIDLRTILQKSRLNPPLIRTFAKQK